MRKNIKKIIKKRAYEHKRNIKKDIHEHEKDVGKPRSKSWDGRDTRKQERSKVKKSLINTTETIMDTKLKFIKEEYIVVDYYDLNEFIQENTPFTEYDVVSDYELCNDSCKQIHIDGKVDKYYQQQY